MITIVDYGLGNIRAFANMYKRLNMTRRCARTADGLAGRDQDHPARRRRIRPRHGAARASGMREPLERAGARAQGAGARDLRRHADPGESQRRRARCRVWAGSPAACGVRGAPAAAAPAAAAHGLERRAARARPPLFSGSRDARFYFLHSYYFECATGRRVAATADYGIGFRLCGAVGQRLRRAVPPREEPPLRARDC